MEKVKNALPIVAIALMLIVFMNTCGTKGKVKSLSKQVEKLELTVEKQDSIIANTVSVERLQNIVELDGLRVSKRNLYDQNVIIRTKVRPDDRMNEYDIEIKAIEAKLK
tara:strand:+ start:182 stop:508 length:327 start_codon:yes stop_codon:yes gene_type:complete